MTTYATRYLTFVRHGQYHNRQDDGDLTPLGIRQIEYTAASLREQHFDTIYHSPLRRAVRSAQILAQAFPGVERVESALLKECVPSLPLELQSLYPTHTPATMKSCQERFTRAWSAFTLPPTEPATKQHELIACHGNIMRYFVTRALGAPLDSWTKMVVHNGGLVRLRVDMDGQVMLISQNDIGHLPTDCRTLG
jgi:serine/threonine-protein phosphatase PGAM5